MTDEEILTELRTIRTLLALEKEGRLEEIVSELSDTQKDIIDELDYNEWRRGFSAELAEEHDVSKRQVQRDTKELVANGLVERQGSGPGTEYRKSALLRAADLVNTL